MSRTARVTAIPDSPVAASARERLPEIGMTVGYFDDGTARALSTSGAPMSSWISSSSSEMRRDVARAVASTSSGLDAAT